jgi:hypothetical protein
MASPAVVPGGNATVTALCPPGKIPIAGGQQNTDPPQFTFSDSYPSRAGWTTLSGWTVRGFLGPTSAPLTFTVYAVCVEAS